MVRIALESPNIIDVKNTEKQKHFPHSSMIET